MKRIFLKRLTLHFFIFLNSFLAGSSIATENKDINIQTRINSIQESMRHDLSAGNIEQARNNLEQASGNFHSVEIELGIIQTLMQAGEYRHALSAAAHTQAEHPDIADTTLFYAWLLAIGGQDLPASQLIQQNLLQLNKNESPDTSLENLLEQLKTHQLDADNIAHSNNIQLKPFIQKNNQKRNLIIASGVLIHNGQQVLTEIPLVEKNTKLQVRNGLGITTNAHIEKTSPATHLTLLTLEKNIPVKADVVISNQTSAFGKPVYAIGYSSKNSQPSTNTQEAAWPQLKMDIPGVPTQGTYAQLHIRYLSPGTGIYDTAGNLIGLLGKDDSQKLILKTLQDFKEQALSINIKNNEAPITSSTKAMDEIYEAALNNSVQVLVSE